MSLVNKMLRDLDARRASEAERSALPSAVTPLTARLETTSPWPKRIAMLLLLMAGAALAMWQWQKASPSAAVTPLPHPEPAPVTTASDKSAMLPPPAATVLTEAPAVIKQPPASKAEAPSQKSSVAALKDPSVHANQPILTGPANETVKAEQGTAPNLILPPLQHMETAKTASTPRIEKREHLPSPAERAEAIYQAGREAQRAGRLEDALAQYQTALAQAPEHAASRQALASLLIDAQRWDAAEKTLREGIDLPATRLASTLMLARLFVERNQIPAALDLMQQQAASGEKSAEYQGFLAVLLNRAGRAREAAERYQAATKLAPSEARWWAGLGIALDADGQTAAAQEAYLKARSLPGLPPELAAHVEQKLR